MQERAVKQERTGWRDSPTGAPPSISARHRQWGWNCPALDIDFLMLEYDLGCVSALVEYKHEFAAKIRLNHPSLRAVADLADRASIPALIVRYANDYSWFLVAPLNRVAREFLSGRHLMSEQEYVQLLYRIRGRTYKRL